jgi:hypothetical protein
MKSVGTGISVVSVLTLVVTVGMIVLGPKPVVVIVLTSVVRIMIGW